MDAESITMMMNASLELQTLNPELKRPPHSFCYVRSELDLPMKG